MKTKIRLKNNIDGKVLSGEVDIPAKDHLQAQIRYPSHKFTLKKFKKPKYKNKIYEE